MPTTWNPSDLTAASGAMDTVLSNGNLTATYTAQVAGATNIGRAAHSFNTGKVFWSLLIGTATNGGYRMGMANTNAMVSQLGADINSIGYNKTGSVQYNASVLATLL